MTGSFGITERFPGSRSRSRPPPKPLLFPPCISLRRKVPSTMIQKDCFSHRFGICLGSWIHRGIRFRNPGLWLDCVLLLLLLLLVVVCGLLSMPQNSLMHIGTRVLRSSVVMYRSTREDDNLDESSPPSWIRLGSERSEDRNVSRSWLVGRARRFGSFSTFWKKFPSSSRWLKKSWRLVLVLELQLVPVISVCLLGVAVDPRHTL
mmetsp:Transcript_15564/g.43116  ORF Transcript_15564/g.43116 Transcript_15564/m.43116 type:complete len:205 (+) Transcript_15564:873-1487(+)